MSAALPDLVDCMRLAEEGVALAREYALREMPRFKDLLAADDGTVHANFAFSKLPSGRAAASVEVQTEVTLICQRCLQPFSYPLQSEGEVEFAATEADELDATHEPYLMRSGMVSLRELAEEEVLMALPASATCSSSQACGNGAIDASSGRIVEPPLETRRPFAGLKELLKKT